MSAPTPPPKPAIAIAIIGAGPAGLTLARLLHTSQESTNGKISVTVFEKDASATARVQVGGTLDLHDDTGLAALRAAGLMAEFEQWARYDGEALVIADKNATGVVRMGGSTKEGQGAWSRPEIDRERLRELLLASVEGAVKWGWKLTAISPEDGMLEFEGRERRREGPFDLVVGADGAWSKVRGVLTAVRPSYSGISGFEIKLSRPNEQFPAVSALVGRGSYFAFSDRKGITAQRMGNESIKVGCWLAEDEGYAQDVLAQHGVEGTRAEILRRYADWAPELRDVVRSGDEDYVVPWTLYELPVGHTWTHKKGFTLIGDAAALMTPFAGEGVNKAMKDALELSAAICRSREAGCGADEGDDLDSEAAKYEKAMFPRVAKVQAETFMNKTAMFQDDAPLGFLMAMMGRVTEEVRPVLLGSLLRVALWPVAFSYFWLRITIGRLVRQLWTRT